MSSISYIRRSSPDSPPTSGPQRAAAYLAKSVLADIGRRAQWLEELGAAWRRLAGEPLGEHSAPLGYRGGRLVIQVDGAVWADQVRHRQRRLLQRLRREALFMDLDTIQIRVRPPQPSDGQPAGGRRRRSASLSAESAELIRAVAAAVPDPELGAALRRLGSRAAREDR